MRFDELKLIPQLLDSARREGYEIPTPIQEKAIPHILAGRDVMGCAQTGTGKTAAFTLPILQRLHSPIKKGPGRRIRCLVLTPTRELASQISESFEIHGSRVGIRHTTIFGGVGQHQQVASLRSGVDVVVATPGRLLDLMNQGYVNLNAVEMFVLDEGDRMLDMGFINDIRKVVAVLPAARQTMLFSATLPKEIIDLASGMLKDPVHVAVAPSATTVEKIGQTVYMVEKENKNNLLVRLLGDQSVSRVLVFARTKHGADKVVRILEKESISAFAIHGNKSQTNRERALQSFKSGRSRVLVATDIASRGLDIPDVTHVINYDLPNEPESYVHRIGRTARAGASGAAVSFCSAEERAFLRDIERLIKLRITVDTEHPYHSNEPARPFPVQNFGGGRRDNHRDQRPRQGGVGQRYGNQERRNYGGYAGAPRQAASTDQNRGNTAQATDRNDNSRRIDQRSRVVARHFARG